MGYWGPAPTPKKAEEYWNEENPDNQLHVVTKRVVCSRCDGYGTHVNPAIDGDSGITQEWLDEAFGADQDEFLEQYTKRGGIYDVRCEECGGDKVVDEMDEERTHPDLVKYFHEMLKDYYEMEAESAMERRMGA